MVKAIAPIDIPEAKAAGMPDGVIDAWNARIAANYSGGQSVIIQNAIVNDICAQMNVSRQEVFAKKWLDIEDIYRAQGWAVDYDKPGYNEDYEASFTFTPKNS